MISDERINALIDKLVDLGIIVILEELTPAERAFYDVYSRKPRMGDSKENAIAAALLDNIKSTEKV